MEDEGIRIRIDPRYQFERGPETDVQFFNHIRFVQIGTDVYLDVGIIPAEQQMRIIAERPKEGKAEFRVLNRLACSINTLAMLRRQLNEIWGKLKPEGLVDRDIRQIRKGTTTLATKKAKKKKK